MERRVVITGYGVLNAVGQNKEEVYQNMFNGKCGIVKLRLKSKSGDVIGSVGFVKLQGQDPFFEENDIPYDKCSELALRAAKECIESSGIENRDVLKHRKGICVGTSQGGMLSGNKFHKQWIEEGYEKADPKLLEQYPLHAISDVLAKKFGFLGVKSTISTACAASGNSVGFGYDMIRSGKFDVMLVGGADPFVPFSFGGFRSLKALDNNTCKPYSESHGINLGEGAAFFLLEDYEGAKARNAYILAEIIGYGLSADAYHQTAPDIGGNGASRAIELAMKQGGISKEDVCYLNGHGTGTDANDKMEDLAYMKIFKDYVDKIPMSSIKGSVGHCLGAAGSVECAVSLMAVQHDKVPPTINFEKPEKNSINHVPNKAQNHICNVVLSNSFAFGGNNCCLALAKPELGFEGTPYEKKNIVITGIGCNGVGGGNVEELFQTFDQQKICIRDITEYNIDAYKCKKAGVMPEVDYAKYMPAKILRRVDPITRLAIASGKQALDDSKVHITQANSGRIGVIYATATGPLDTIESVNRSILEKGFNDVNPSDFPNTVINAAPGNFCIANMLKGPTSTISTGGTSSLVAFAYSSELINSGQADVVVVIGADLNNEILHLGNDKLSLLSESGISPLCEGADGMILAQGSVAFVIESEEHAKEREAHIYARVKGYSLTSDNEGLCTVSEDGNEYAICIKEALKESGLDHVDLFASGSVGNAKTDCCEVNAVKDIFKKDTYLSNVQTLIGSTSGCVGFYGMLSSIYSFEKGKVLSMPADAKGEIRSDISMKYQKGDNQDAEIKTACVDAISYGGGYASVVLEKY